MLEGILCLVSMLQLLFYLDLCFNCFCPWIHFTTAVVHRIHRIQQLMYPESMLPMLPNPCTNVIMASIVTVVHIWDPCTETTAAVTGILVTTAAFLDPCYYFFAVTGSTSHSCTCAYRIHVTTATVTGFTYIYYNCCCVWILLQLLLWPDLCYNIFCAVYPCYNCYSVFMCQYMIHRFFCI